MGLNPHLAQGLVLDSMNLDPQVNNFVHFEGWSGYGFRETPGTHIQFIWIQKTGDEPRKKCAEPVFK
jgi:hypothetical protein